jgi:hypothetical protein
MENQKIEGVRKKSAEQIIKEKKKLKAFLMAVIPSNYDRFDLEANYDSSLSYSENKDIITDKIKDAFDDFKGASLKEKIQIEESKMEKFRAERDAEIEAEILKHNKRNYVANKELDDFYKDITRAINKMAAGYSHLAFIKGRGAIGKSYSIRRVLIETNTKFYEVCGDVTEAYLYRLFFEHNGEVIWFKDTVRVLRGLNCLPFYTEVKTNNGIKTMKNLNHELDLIASWNFKTQKMEYKKFRKEAAGLKKVIKIKTSIGYLESSPEHKWIVKTKDGRIIEKKAKDLSVNDVLLQL